MKNHLTYDEAFELLQKSKSREFEFKNEKALKIFNANYFTKNELLNFEKEININNLIKEINKTWSLDYDKTQEKTYLFGYSLSKKGILIGFSQMCYGFNGLWCVSCQENK